MEAIDQREPTESDRKAINGWVLSLAERVVHKFRPNGSGDCAYGQATEDLQLELRRAYTNPGYPLLACGASVEALLVKATSSRMRALSHQGYYVGQLQTQILTGRAKNIRKPVFLCFLVSYNPQKGFVYKHQPSDGVPVRTMTEEEFRAEVARSQSMSSNVAQSSTSPTWIREGSFESMRRRLAR